GAVAGIFVAVNVMSCQYFDKWQTTACCISWASQCLNVFFMPQVANYFRLEYGTPGMFLLLGALTLNGFPPTILLHSPPWLRVPRAQGETRSSKVLLAVKETGTNLTENSADHLDTEASQGEDGALVSDIQKDVSEQTQPDCHPSKILSVKPTSDLKQTLKAFLTPTFLVDTLSFAVQIYSMTTFYLVHIDLALDYGIESDHSIYFIHIYSVGDYLMRVLSGVIVDRGCMSLTTVMVLGFIGNAAGFEALAWSRSFIPFVFVTLFLGVSGGIMAALPAPVLISDFQGRSLSILLGGMLFMEGLVVMTRPSLIEQLCTLSPDFRYARQSRSSSKTQGLEETIRACVEIDQDRRDLTAQGRGLLTKDGQNPPSDMHSDRPQARSPFGERAGNRVATSARKDSAPAACIATEHASESRDHRLARRPDDTPCVCGRVVATRASTAALAAMEDQDRGERIRAFLLDNDLHGTELELRVIRKYYAWHGR
ncbi:hypothetical protein HPB47_016114, partial [Ixodes persulcatus]